MTGFVLDASAYVLAFTEVSPPARALAARIVAGDSHVPHLMSAEVGAVARSKVARGELTAAHALALVEEVAVVVQHHYVHRPLIRLAWSLRANLSFYDGLYVALAASLGVPLLTADARLSRAPVLPCAVETVS
ncbi:type II toxin-antitoxin system VapC family toxin [Pseudonocardia sp.]|uniref:type II toxin-antitoxin system VapC family toxin n=1 Tax=Pseudonocardia sp. TaxID=60912 RepID=UPI00260455D5|nr:type II toxin-antitoxin system VapC family toxin [Pseudonocardia sp.]